MKIFITGIAGFLGSHLADKFIKEGYQVAGCDSLIGGYKDNVSKNSEFYKLDCSNYSDLKKIMNGSNIVYHCAATAYEGLSSFSPNFITQNIVQNSISVFTAAISTGVKKIIYCSSMARYGNIKPPFKETDVPLPEDVYGIGKLAAEKMLINLCETHGLDYTIAVPHNIYGPRQKYDDPYRNVVSIMINLMLQKRQPIIYGDGNQKRCFSYISDCIESLYKMSILKQTNSQIYNIGPDENFITINELSEKIANKLAFNINPQYFQDRPREVKNAYCSSEKIKSELDYKTNVFLDEGLDEIISYIKKRGPKKFDYKIDLEIKSDITPKTWLKKIF